MYMHVNDILPPLEYTYIYILFDIQLIRVIINLTQ